MKRRDGTFASIEKKRGFVDYHREWLPCMHAFMHASSYPLRLDAIAHTHTNTHTAGNPDPYRDPLDRVFDWGEIKADEGHDEIERKIQAARCMDCGAF